MRSSIITIYLKRLGLYAAVLSLLISTQPFTAHSLSPQQRRYIDSGARYFDVEKTTCVSQSGIGGLFDDPLLSIGYPPGGFSNEAALVAAAESLIQGRYAASPWLGRVQWIFDESEKTGVNPLYIIAVGGVESTWGNSKWGKINNNYYGVDQGKKKFSSVDEGIRHLIDVIPRNLSGEGAGGLYSSVKNIYEYNSVHQTGSIVYPGQPFDPRDIDTKPGITQDLWDATMKVWISWDETRNDGPEVNPKYRGNTYNPLAYYSLAITFINQMTNSNFPVEFSGTPVSSGSSGADCPPTSLTPVGENTQFIDGFTIYKQYDPAWANLPYGAPRPGDERTIASSGCGPTAMAMIITTLTGQTVTPAETAAFGMQPATKTWSSDGGSDGVSLAEKMAPNWGLTATYIGPNIEAINNTLRSGGLVIVSGRGGLPFTTGGHFVVIRALTAEGKWLVGDSSNRLASPDTSTTPWEPQALVNNFTAGGYSSYAITKGVATP